MTTSRPRLVLGLLLVSVLSGVAAAGRWVAWQLGRVGHFGALEKIATLLLIAAALLLLAESVR